MSIAFASMCNRQNQIVSLQLEFCYVLLEEKGLKYKGYSYSEFSVLSDREEPQRNLWYHREQFLIKP